MINISKRTAIYIVVIIILLLIIGGGFFYLNNIQTNNILINIPSNLPNNISITTNAGVLTKPGSLKIIPPTTGVYLGTYNWQEYGKKPGVKEFEDALGKKVAIVGARCVTPENLSFKIDVVCLNDLYNRGYVTEIDISGRVQSTGSIPKRFTAQEIIDGKADFQLREIAQDLITFNKPIFLGYPREPVAQGPIIDQRAEDTMGFGFTSWGYGPKGDKLPNQVTEAGRYTEYTSLTGDSCNDPENLSCDDSRERYRDMARHIHNVIESIAPSHATWVMGAVIDRTKRAYVSWYPGDKYVDWLAIDEYPSMHVSDTGVAGKYFFAEDIEPDWSEALALAPNKPFMITELGVTNNKTVGSTDKDSKVEFYDRALWFLDFFKKARSTHNQLRAIMYWQMGADTVPDTRIRVGDTAALAWRADILANPNFWVSDIMTAGGGKVTGPGGGIASQTTGGNTENTSGVEKPVKQEGHGCVGADCNFINN